MLTTSEDITSDISRPYDCGFCSQIKVTVTVQWLCFIFWRPHHTLDNGSVWHKDWPFKVYVDLWPIFCGPVILPYILKVNVIDLKMFCYIKWRCQLGVFVPLRALAVVVNVSELEPLPQSPVSKVPVTQQDPAFFDNVQNDVSRILRQEKMQEEYKKVSVTKANRLSGICNQLLTPNYRKTLTN